MDVWRYTSDRLISGELKLEPGKVATPGLADKSQGFPAFLKSRSGLKVIGSYGPVGFVAGCPDVPPGIFIIDTNNEADLGAINVYWAPYTVFSFYRYNEQKLV